MRYLGWKNLDKAFDSLEEELVKVVRGLAIETFEKILRRSPIDQGRMIVSYTFTIGQPQFIDRSYLVEGQFSETPGPWQSGRDFLINRRGRKARAENLARAQNSGQSLGFTKLGQTIYISNGVDHGEGYYAGLIESGQQPLRAANRPGRPVFYTLAEVQRRYGSNVSKANATRLAQKVL